MDEICDSMYWVDLNAYDDNEYDLETEILMNIDDDEYESDVLKNTDDTYIVQND